MSDEFVIKKKNIPNALSEGLFQSVVADFVNERLDVVHFGVQKDFGRVVSSSKRQQIDRSQPGLFTRGHKHYDWLARTVSLDGVVRRSGHRQKPRRRVRHVQALNIKL